METISDLDWLRAEAHRLADEKLIPTRGNERLERLAIFVHEVSNGVPAYEAAARAGFPAGHPRGESERVRNLSASASRFKQSVAFKKLLAAFLEWRQGQGNETLMPSEVLQVLSETVRRGSGAERNTAAKLLLDYHDKRGKRAGDYSHAEICMEAMRPGRSPLVRVMGAAGAIVAKRAGDPDFKAVTLPSDLHELFERRRDFALPALMDLIDTLRKADGRTEKSSATGDGASPVNGTGSNGAAETAGHAVGAAADDRLRVAGGAR